MPHTEQPEQPEQPEDPREPEDPELAAWRDIVAHYGDRAELSAEEAGGAGADPEADGASEDPQAGPSYPQRFGVFDDHVDEPFEPVDEGEDGEDGFGAEGRFVPPEPEPIQLTPARTAAWIGVLGAPLAALLATVVVTATSLSVPTWVGALLVVAFLGGFGYLVVTMPKDRDDPWDDGARL